MGQALEAVIDTLSTDLSTAFVDNNPKPKSNRDFHHTHHALL
jgi:hypothetical protein